MMNDTFDPSGNMVQRHQTGAAQLADFTTLYDGFSQQLGCISANSGAQAAAAGNEMIGFGGQFGCWTDNENSMNDSLVEPTSVRRIAVYFNCFNHRLPAVGRPDVSIGNCDQMQEARVCENLAE